MTRLLKRRAQRAGLYGKGHICTSWQKKKENYSSFSLNRLWTQQAEKHYCSFCLFSYQWCIEISMFLLCSRVFFFPSETQRAKVVNQWKHSRNQCHEILCSLSTVRQCPCLMMWARQKKWAMTTQRVAVSHDAVDSRAVALIRSWLKD